MAKTVTTATATRCPSHFCFALAALRSIAARNDASQPGTSLVARCGEGLVALALARRFPAARVTAHDIDTARIAEARQHPGASRVRFEVSDSLTLRHFDLDSAFVALDHRIDNAQEDLFPLLVSLRNAIKRSGLVVIGNSDLFGAYAPNDLRDLASSAGFSRITPSESTRRAAAAASSLSLLELRR